MDIPIGVARTVKQIIDDVDDVCPNAYPETVKTRWISQLDMLIWRDLCLQTPISRFEYTWPESQDVQVLVSPPDDDIYDLRLKALIANDNGEYDKYLNIASFYDARYREFAAWFINVYQPAQGYEGWESIYKGGSLRRWQSGY
ncbi:MAG: hypothetical protein LBD92_07990 [Oscillospiraceae bacterium]|jgi:hypothetical protein|nr:hypothetical protein [Oscillospiraceae bacterium]